MLADRPRQRHAVELGHVHVEDGEIERLAGLDPRKCLARRAGYPHDHAPRAQIRVQDPSIRVVVVDGEDALALERWLRAAQLTARGHRAFGGGGADAEPELRAVADAAVDRNG